MANAFRQRDRRSVQPRGDEAVGADENAADAVLSAEAMALGCCTGGRKGPGALGRTDAVHADEPRAESIENREVAAGQHRGGIGLESEREPLMAREEAVEPRFAVRRLTAG